MGKYQTKNQLNARENYTRYNTFVKFKLFLKYVKICGEDECWIWTGDVCGDYGRFWWAEKHIYLAHVAAYRLFIGSIPKRHGKKKLQVCHSCDTPKCVNPKHLWLGTQKQNIKDCMEKGRRYVQSGENNHSAKLKQEQVNEMRTLYDKGTYTQEELATKFNISRGHISSILAGKLWE